MKPHLGWYSRDYLPHVDRPGLVQGITFRLADSIPAEVIAGWRDDIAHLPEGEQKTEFQRRVADYLDAGTVNACCAIRASHDSSRMRCCISTENATGSSHGW